MAPPAIPHASASNNVGSSSGPNVIRSAGVVDVGGSVRTTLAAHAIATTSAEKTTPAPIPAINRSPIRRSPDAADRPPITVAIKGTSRNSRNANEVDPDAIPYNHLAVFQFQGTIEDIRTHLKEGDTVLFTMWAGDEFKEHKGEAILVMREEDVLAVIDKPTKTEKK
jgi:hypothetical protein